ncbi:hypothetical protein [Methanolacinia paynteri]|uniref:hypothetical protein n=1 Tax=Methanolacinia paynteri TaxID=230356 RepID=UPI00064ED08C|nr:hypothetical protein [Methanolacinia paynteri]
MPFNEKKKNSVNNRGLVVVLILLFIVISVSSGCLDSISKRAEITRQLEQAEPLMENVESEIADMNVYLSDPGNSDSVEVQSRLAVLKSDMNEINTIMAGIDRSALTESEREDLDAGLFAMEYMSDFIDSVSVRLPEMLRIANNMEDAAEARNVQRARSAMHDMHDLIESFLSDLDVLEDKLVEKQESSDSEKIDEFCSQNLAQIRDWKSQFKTLQREIDEVL